MNKNIGFLLIALCSATALNGMTPNEPTSVRLSRWICKHPALVVFTSSVAGAGAGYAVARARDSKHTVAYPVGSGTAGLLFSVIMDQACRRICRADREARTRDFHFAQGFCAWQAFMLGRLNEQSADYLRVKSIESYTQMTPMERLIAARELQLHPDYSAPDMHDGKYLRKYIQELVEQASQSK